MTAATCHSCCGQVICAEDACQALGNLYHTACFQCSSCGRTLKGKAFYCINEKIYCEEDYNLSGLQVDAFRCKICDDVIRDLVLHTMGSYYHPGCLKCCICEEWLNEDQFTVGPDNEIYCIADYHKVYAPKCFSCRHSILPVDGLTETVKVVAMDKYFHVDCYHCEICGMQLTDEPDKRCYPLLDHLLCHNCHLQRIKSSKINTALAPSGAQTDDKLPYSPSMETSTSVLYNDRNQCQFERTNEKYQNTQEFKSGSLNLTTPNLTPNMTKYSDPIVSQNVVLTTTATLSPHQKTVASFVSTNANNIKSMLEQSSLKADVLSLSPKYPSNKTAITSTGIIIHSMSPVRNHAYVSLEDKCNYSNVTNSLNKVTHENSFTIPASGINKYSTSSLNRRHVSGVDMSPMVLSTGSTIKEPDSNTFRSEPRQERTVNYSTASLERRNVNNMSKMSTFQPFTERTFTLPETKNFPSPGPPTMQKQLNAIPVPVVGYSTLSLGRRRRRPEANDLLVLHRSNDFTDPASSTNFHNYQ